MLEQAINSDQTEIYKQMTELGLQEAADMVSSLGQVNLVIKAVSVNYQDHQKVINILDDSVTELVAIGQSLEGDIEGQALFLMHEEACRSMIRELLNERALLRELTEMEEEALTEIGNIILNSCLSNYLQLFKGKVVSQLPTISKWHIKQLLSVFFEKNKRNVVMMVEISLESKYHQYSGYLLFNELPWHHNHG
ncbi:MAG: hypothetical protein QNJ56_06925 [Gammaproteobacteria bacterium]|nr:hypothetical protein [Gammaproteobacteria bacterium]